MVTAKIFNLVLNKAYVIGKVAYISSSVYSLRCIHFYISHTLLYITYTAIYHIPFRMYYFLRILY